MFWLRQDDWARARTALKLDDRMGVIQARDLSKHVIKSAADGLELVKRATANRRVRIHSSVLSTVVASKAKRLYELCSGSVGI